MSIRCCVHAFIRRPSLPVKAKAKMFRSYWHWKQVSEKFKGRIFD